MELFRLKTKLTRGDLAGRRIKDVAPEMKSVDERRLREILDDSWRTLRREHIEDICSFFGMTRIDELFELQPVMFWEPIRSAERYYILTEEPENEMMPADHDAASQLRQYLFRKTDLKQPRLRCPDAAEAQRLLSNENCILVGLRKNKAVEVALCNLFGAEPFDTSYDNRQKLQVRIRRKKVEGLPPAAFLELDEDEFGIVIKDKTILQGEIFQGKTFHKKRIQDGVDGGLIVIAERRSGDRTLVTAIVAGLTSLGTLEAARILGDSPKQLFPSSGKFAVTVTRTSYRKRPDVWSREVIETRILRTDQFPLPKQRKKARPNKKAS